MNQKVNFNCFIFKVNLIKPKNTTKIDIYQDLIDIGCWNIIKSKYNEDLEICKSITTSILSLFKSNFKENQIQFNWINLLPKLIPQFNKIPEHISTKKIGKGAFAKVYKAKNENNEIIALKKIEFENLKELLKNGEYDENVAELLLQREILFG